MTVLFVALFPTLLLVVLLSKRTHLMPSTQGLFSEASQIKLRDEDPHLSTVRHLINGIRPNVSWFYSVYVMVWTLVQTVGALLAERGRWQGTPRQSLFVFATSFFNMLVTMQLRPYVDPLTYAFSVFAQLCTTLVGLGMALAQMDINAGGRALLLSLIHI